MHRDGLFSWHGLVQSQTLQAVRILSAEITASTATATASKPTAASKATATPSTASRRSSRARAPLGASFGPFAAIQSAIATTNAHASKRGWEAVRGLSAALIHRYLHALVVQGAIRQRALQALRLQGVLLL